MIFSKENFFPGDGSTYVCLLFTPLERLDSIPQFVSISIDRSLVLLDLSKIAFDRVRQRETDARKDGDKEERS